MEVLTEHDLTGLNSTDLKVLRGLRRTGHDSEQQCSDEETASGNEHCHQAREEACNAVTIRGRWQTASRCQRLHLEQHIVSMLRMRNHDTRRFSRAQVLLPKLISFGVRAP